MGKVTGFLEWSRELPDKRAIEERLRDWRELYADLPLEKVRQQAGRCMDCGIPYCHQGCPLGNPIPDFNDAVYRDRWQEAYRRLSTTNNFPEFTGRLCPAPCEGACTLGYNLEPVAIEQIEKEIIERAFDEGWVKPQTPRARTNSHIAVVGSGPAGLAAAAQLNAVGHRVTVYEADDRLGGLLRYGIPDFKLEKWVIDRRLQLMEAAGIEFMPGTRVGISPTWDALRAGHDALLIAIGSQHPRELQVPGRDLANVHMAMDFLRQQNHRVAGDFRGEGSIDVANQRVIVLGGGDTGSDCVGTALRQGAASVLQLELLPAPPKSRAPTNPWPQWPVIFRTSSSHEEGGERDFSVMTKRLAGTDGKLESLHGVRVDLLPKASGGMEICERDGTEFSLPVDRLILAMGFVGPDTNTLVEQLGIELDGRGNVQTDGRHATSRPGVFAAGDAHRGASLIVWAIAEGREAARAIDASLRTDHQPWLPTRGIDQPVGGR